MFLVIGARKSVGRVEVVVVVGEGMEGRRRDEESCESLSRALCVGDAILAKS